MRLTKDIERPELTERKYKAINTCYYNSPAACADKLGEYENIDESPEHLAKVKRAFDIIKEKRVNVDNFLNHIKKDTDYKEYKRLCGLYKIMVFSDKALTEEEYESVKEVLL